MRTKAFGGEITDKYEKYDNNHLYSHLHHPAGLRAWVLNTYNNVVGGHPEC